MLIKINAKNQITMPRSLMQAVGPTDYFDVQAKDGQIVLTPARFIAADAVRAKLLSTSETRYGRYLPFWA